HLTSIRARVGMGQTVRDFLNFRWVLLQSLDQIVGPAHRDITRVWKSRYDGGRELSNLQVLGDRCITDPNGLSELALLGEHSRGQPLLEHLAFLKGRKIS